MNKLKNPFVIAGLLGIGFYLYKMNKKKSPN